MAPHYFSYTTHSVNTVIKQISNANKGFIWYSESVRTNINGLVKDHAQHKGNQTIDSNVRLDNRLQKPLIRWYSLKIRDHVNEVYI